jgi:hypothetical protein
MEVMVSVEDGGEKSTVQLNSATVHYFPALIGYPGLISTPT